MYIDYSFAKVITILGLSNIKAEKKDMIALLYPHLFVPLQPQICRGTCSLFVRLAVAEGPQRLNPL